MEWKLAEILNLNDPKKFRKASKRVKTFQADPKSVWISSGSENLRGTSRQRIPKKFPDYELSVPDFTQSSRRPDEPTETSELVVEEGNRQAEIYHQQHHSSSVTVEAAVSESPSPIVSSSVVPAGPIRAVSSHNSSSLNVRGIGNNSTTLSVEDGHQGDMLTETSLSVEESHQLSTVNQLSSVDYELNAGSLPPIVEKHGADGVNEEDESLEHVVNSLKNNIKNFVMSL
ncbi:uncharacterized protein LOC124343064 [Daphnia pulicaria]|uniref:uncharacterized protein LOC124343064 n=1 Tax=Daphnia pulicaria TaxID=35523 RepID=UPI001EEB6AF2|nr:uncharacterized protein LOC124343064 [Daphnia pulicaria]